MILKEDTAFHYYSFICPKCLKVESRLVDEEFAKELSENDFYHRCVQAIEKELI